MRITQPDYEYFRDSIEELISRYREEFSIPVTTNWREIIRRFMDDPMNYLREYFKRNASESGFSSDKRTTGGLIYQRRKDRKETSEFCKGLIHMSQMKNVEFHFRSSFLSEAIRDARGSPDSLEDML